MLLFELRLKIQLVLVPSNRDLHHDLVYPQPPYPSQLLKQIKDLKSEVLQLHAFTLFKECGVVCCESVSHVVLCVVSR